MAGREKRDIENAQGAFVVTAYTEDLTLSGTDTVAANVAAVLATVINNLIEQGILIGTVSA